MSNSKPTRKRAPKPLPSIEYLHECLDFDPKTGILTWKDRPISHFETQHAWIVWNAQNPRTIAGCVRDDGRLVICINGCKYKAHRIAWKMQTGKEPPETLDHKDLDPSNNRWKNLRPATWPQQNWNKRHQENSASGFRGVYPSKNRWRARIRINGIKTNLGTFSTPEEASAVVEATLRKLHGSFYRP
jgi:hypothetical protein